MYGTLHMINVPSYFLLPTNVVVCLIDHSPIGCSWQSLIPTIDGFTLCIKFFRHDPTIRVPNQTQIFLFILQGSNFKDEMGKTTSHVEDFEGEESNNVKRTVNLSLPFYVFSPLSIKTISQKQKVVGRFNAHVSLLNAKHWRPKKLLLLLLYNVNEGSAM